MGWRIVYIEESMDLKLYLDNIKVIKPNNIEYTIPLSDIHSLIIDNPKVNITTPLMLKCSDYNINFILCNIEHMPNTIIEPINGNYQTPLVLKKQISWNEDYKRIMHQFIIKNKIQNQIDLLKYLDKDLSVISKMFEFMQEVSPGDSGNREGLAAKIYFRELFGPNFKRFDDDVINSGLNYGYAILRSQISKTIIAKGLNPTLGIFHKGFDNKFNLSDDLIEVFRPLIDEYVYIKLKDTLIFKKENRLDLIKQTLKNVIIEHKQQSLFNAISIFVDKIINFFDTGDLDSYEKVTLIYEL